VVALVQDPRNAAVNPATSNQKAAAPRMTDSVTMRARWRRRDRLRRYARRIVNASLPVGGTPADRRTRITPSDRFREARTLGAVCPCDPLVRGLPQPQPRSKSLRLRHHDRDVGELHLAACLRGLVRHQLPDPREHRLLHREDLRIDLPPEERLLERGGGQVRLVLHAQAVVAASRRRDDVGSVLGDVIRLHCLVIQQLA
jgi:hypothetical protein